MIVFLYLRAFPIKEKMPEMSDILEIERLGAELNYFD